jgi:hypothetical protein
MATMTEKALMQNVTPLQIWVSELRAGPDPLVRWCNVDKKKRNPTIFKRPSSRTYYVNMLKAAASSSTHVTRDTILETRSQEKFGGDSHFKNRRQYENAMKLAGKRLDGTSQP